MLMYSPNKYNPSFIEEYSVWKPPINSDSDSGKSKGVLLASAKAQIKNIKNCSRSWSLYGRCSCTTAH